MKKIAIIFAIVGFVTGVAYPSLEDLMKRYAEKQVSISQEEKNESLKEIFKKEYREEAKLVKVMSEGTAEVNAEFQQQTEQTTNSLEEAIVIGFSLIPDVVWAAIIASGLTLSGVYLSNKANRKCLLEQLNHAAKEKNKERKMSLRRDIYLSAVAKIGQQVSYLASFYNTTETLAEGYHEAIQRVNVIGSNETIVALNQFNDHMIEAFTELIPMKEEINLLEERNKLLMGIMGQGIEIKKNTIGYTKIFEKKST